MLRSHRQYFYRNCFGNECGRKGTLQLNFPNTELLLLLVLLLLCLDIIPRGMVSKLPIFGFVIWALDEAKKQNEQIN
eukprot:3316086-Amphidinium_carterae.1